MLNAKIHGATVTEANINYTGSILIDSTLLQKLDILPYERVQVLNINNGARFETYVIVGPADSGAIEINGAAARLAVKGDKVIIISYKTVDEKEARSVTPKIGLVDSNNRITELRTA